MIDEVSRHRLFTKLQNVLGVDDAAVLIGHLPPVGWADVATKRDLLPLETGLEDVRTEFRTFRSEMRSEVEALRSEMKSEIGGLRSEFVALRSELGTQFRTTLFTMMSLMMILTGIVFTAVKLG